MRAQLRLLPALFLLTSQVFSAQPATEQPGVPRVPPTIVEAQPPTQPTPPPEPSLDQFPGPGQAAPQAGYGITGLDTPLTGTTTTASEGVVGQPELQSRPLLRST